MRLLLSALLPAFILGIVVPMLVPGVLTLIEPMICPEGMEAFFLAENPEPGTVTVNPACRGKNGVIHQSDEIVLKTMALMTAVFYVPGLVIVLLLRLLFRSKNVESLTAPLEISVMPSNAKQTERLNALSEQVASGEITLDEYDRRRQEILDGS